MKHYFLSDLHMADGGTRDNFSSDPHREDHLLRFCDFVGNDRLMRLGDWFDLWQAPWWKIEQQYASVIDRLWDMDTTAVYGNHDADLGNWQCGGRDRIIETIGGRRFLFVHGHQFDPINSAESPGWARIFTIVAGLMEDANGSPVLSDGTPLEDQLSAWGRKFLLAYDFLRWNKTDSRKSLTYQQRGRPRNYFLEGAELERLSVGADTIVCGHTHEFGRVGRRYFNCGSWTWNMMPFLCCEEDGTMLGYEWTGYAARPLDVELG